MEESSVDLISFHCPRWDELPDIDLYMDQVVSILEKYLNIFIDDEGEKIITPTMINNYVKQKYVKPPEKKRYNREHLAYLFIFSILKRILSITEVSDLIKLLTYEKSVVDAYTLFCEELENALQHTFTEGYQENGLSADVVNDVILLKAVTSALANKIYFQKEIKKFTDSMAESDEQQKSKK